MASDDRTFLASLEAIKALKGRYFYHLDRKDWASWGAVFMPDAVLDVRGEYPASDDPSEHVHTGVRAIVEMVSTSLVGVVTVHHGHTPLIEMTGEASASGVWAMEDNLFMRDGTRMTGYGHYHEDYLRTDGEWRIARSTLIRLHKIFA